MTSASTTSHSSAAVAVKSCSHCQRTSTPIWRKAPNGDILCNACGLYLKQQGKMRPLSLDLKVNNAKKLRKKDTSAAAVTSGAPNSVTSDKEHQMQETEHGKKRPLEEIMEEVARPRKTKPLKMNNLPLSTAPYDYLEEQELYSRSRGPVSIVYKGERYYLGDFVAVYGDDHPEYYGVITDFEVRGNEKYFLMKWLVPKSRALLQLRIEKDTLSAYDFIEPQPDIITCERMDMIKYVFDSIPSFAVSKVYPEQSNSLNLTKEEEKIAAVLQSMSPEHEAQDLHCDPSTSNSVSPEPVVENHTAQLKSPKLPSIRYEAFTSNPLTHHYPVTYDYTKAMTRLPMPNLIAASKNQTFVPLLPSLGNAVPFTGFPNPYHFSLPKDQHDTYMFTNYGLHSAPVSNINSAANSGRATPIPRPNLSPKHGLTEIKE